jgi:hypothetical protein
MGLYEDSVKAYNQMISVEVHEEHDELNYTFHTNNDSPVRDTSIFNFTG